MAGWTPNIDTLGSDGLKKLVLRLVEDNAALKEENAALREEIARLKGLKGKPRLRPSGMEKATAGKPKGETRKKGRGPIAKRTIDKTQIVEMTPPPGSCFKGYEDLVMEDLVIRPWVIRYRRQRWRTPDGTTLVAPQPSLDRCRVRRVENGHHRAANGDSAPLFEQLSQNVEFTCFRDRDGPAAEISHSMLRAFLWAVSFGVHGRTVWPSPNRVTILNAPMARYAASSWRTRERRLLSSGMHEPQLVPAWRVSPMASTVVS